MRIKNMKRIHSLKLRENVQLNLRLNIGFWSQACFDSMGSAEVVRQNAAKANMTSWFQVAVCMSLHWRSGFQPWHMLGTRILRTARARKGYSACDLSPHLSSSDYRMIQVVSSLTCQHRNLDREWFYLPFWMWWQLLQQVPKSNEIPYRLSPKRCIVWGFVVASQSSTMKASWSLINDNSTITRYELTIRLLRIRSRLRFLAHDFVQVQCGEYRDIFGDYCGTEVPPRLYA